VGVLTEVLFQLRQERAVPLPVGRLSFRVRPSNLGDEVKTPWINGRSDRGLRSAIRSEARRAMIIQTQRRAIIWRTSRRSTPGRSRSGLIAPLAPVETQAE
jgi:hypothetical protein